MFRAITIVSVSVFTAFTSVGYSDNTVSFSNAEISNNGDENNIGRPLFWEYVLKWRTGLKPLCLILLNVCSWD